MPEPYVIPTTVETDGDPKDSLTVELTPKQVDYAIAYWLMSLRHVRTERKKPPGTIKCQVRLGTADAGEVRIVAYLVKLWFLEKEQGKETGGGENG